MADFVAVLKKTLDGLDNPTAETRKKVYDKARMTIAAKLAAIDPPPPPSVINRQKDALEAAIKALETELSGSSPAAEEDPLADFVSGAAFSTSAPREEPAPAAAAPPEPLSPDDEQPMAPEATPAETAPLAGDADPVAGTPPPARKNSPAAKKRGGAGLILALIVLLVLGGGGYAIWQNKDDFASLFGVGDAGTDMATDVPADENADAPADAASEPAETADAEQDTAAEEAAGEPKLTQRLMEDGTEVDPGPAGGEATVGEGTSVAAATVPDDPASDAAENSGAAEETGAAVPEGTTLPVGQKAIFYEERTNDLQGSAEPGSVVWSLVEESPGGDLPPEPAIRAEATIPGRDVQFRMTIRRNGDETLPASHIIEMIFLTPENFEGGGIENILRVTFKDSEEAAGNPLLGIPAKIADGFFLLALTDGKAEMEANNTMMRRLDWLDIPIVYRSGRRALITMEKGLPGEKVFDQALKAWEAGSSG